MSASSYLAGTARLQPCGHTLTWREPPHETRRAYTVQFTPHFMPHCDVCGERVTRMDVQIAEAE